MTNRTKVLFLFLAMLGAISVRAYAQQKTSEKISPKERWAFETNAMDWLLLLPNAKVEFDLSSSTDNRWVVGIGAKWNGNAKITSVPYTFTSISSVTTTKAFCRS